jgi:hypothetical protein
MKYRNLMSVILLSLFTLGIYQLLWTRWTRDEMVAQGQKVPKFSILLLPIALMLLLMVPLIIMSASAGGSLDSTNDGAFGPILGLGILLSTIAVIGVTVWWYHRYCKAAENLTKGHMPYGTSYGLWWVLAIVGVSFVWPGIMQDAFNKLAVDNPLGQQPTDTPYPNAPYSVRDNPPAASNPNDQQPTPPTSFSR